MPSFRDPTTEFLERRRAALAALRTAANGTPGNSEGKRAARERAEAWRRDMQREMAAATTVARACIN